MVQVIQFIQSDLRREKTQARLLLILFVFGTAAIPALLGFVMRVDLNGVFEPHALLPNLFAATLLALFPLIYQKRARLSTASVWVAATTLIAAFGFSSARLFASSGNLAEFTSKAAFSNASESCFLKGLLGSVLVGTWLCLFVFHFSSLPSRRWRTLSSVAAGVAASVMLGVHCDSSSLIHVSIGHWGAGAVVGSLLYFGQEYWFRKILQSRVPDLLSRIDSANKIS
ncbi:MAG: DUF1109 family protein [Bdellovibrionales bacterium]|nr:DUF1109 family protein [Oligoflexia bacterium]